MKCTCCHTYKPLEDFYPSKNNLSGRQGKCKICYGLDCKKRYLLNKQDPVWMAKERARCRLKADRVRKSGGYWPQPSYAVKQAWRQRNRKKRIAHDRARAIRRNPEQSCNRCGVVPEILHRHHPDYSKPLEIVWLCPACHGLAHRKSTPQTEGVTP